MRLRTQENYDRQKKKAIAFGRNPWGVGFDPQSKIGKDIGLNSKGGLDKVLFGTCDTCTNYFFENILGGPEDAPGYTYACTAKHCFGIVSQIHIIMEEEE